MDQKRGHCGRKTRRLSVFDHHCLRSIAGVWWEHRISNAEVRRRVFGSEGANKSIEVQLNLHRLRWLGHVLRMPENRLPRQALFSEIGEGWKKRRGGQSMTWQRSMKALTASLSHVGRVRLPGWSPRDATHTWLETLSDMAKCRSQWRSCIYSLSLAR